MKPRFNILPFAFLALPILAACTPAEENPHDLFFENLTAHCGNAYQGKVTVGDPALDSGWMRADIVIEVKECTDDRIRIPLHVDNDHSRTWVLSRTTEGLTLKHDHRNEDGSEDIVNGYGGNTIAIGSATHQVFPIDDYSKLMFSEHGMVASVTNTWVISFPNEQTLRYQLMRENRDFQVEIDLSTPVEAPPAPWGWRDHETYTW